MHPGCWGILGCMEITGCRIILEYKEGIPGFKEVIPEYHQWIPKFKLVLAYQGILNYKVILDCIKMSTHGCRSILEYLEILDNISMWIQEWILGILE